MSVLSTAWTTKSIADLSRMAPERRPYQGGLLIKFFSEPDLAAGCGVIAREERFQPRQDRSLQDFTVFVRAHGRLVRLIVYPASGSSTACASQRPRNPGILPAFAMTSL